MSGIVLSASVRQNLLSLQSTADLLATTQNRLATGKKVNTALDNPTNFFTAASLDNRSSDINNLLDGIGNGVQVLQAANTGISSLQKLVDSAKSVANQALQASVGYSQKSSVSTTAIAGATAADLRGTAGAASAGTLTAGAFTTVNVSGTGGPATAAADVTGTGFAAVDVSTGSVAFTLDVDGTSQAITIDATAVSAYNTAATATLDEAALTAQDVADIINYQFNGATGTTAPVTVVGGELQISSAATGTGSNVTITGFASTANAGSVGLANAANTGAAATSADALSFTVTVDGGSASTVTLSAATVAAYNTANSTSLSAAALSANDVASIIHYQVGSTVASVAAGALVFTSGTTGTSSSVATSAVTGTATAGSTGITAATDAGAAGASPLNGLTLSIGATGNGTATTITFGDGTGGTVKSLNDLNAALSSNNLQASINSAGVITISTTNDAASSTIGAITGTAAGAGAAFNGLTGSTPVQDPAALQIRSNLVAQYNNILDQITSTSQDASYNGVNLLNGDQLKLTFNETGTSTLKIQGVSFNAIGLGLSKLASGTDFLDNSSATAALKTLDAASSTLRSQASALGSNLSIVQIRQDFSKNLINVLQTGSSNLTLADTNEEAANSQALSTRQSIAVSALALANQSQQSVLQLLR